MQPTLKVHSEVSNTVRDYAMAKSEETGHTEFMMWASSTPAESIGTQRGQGVGSGDATEGGRRKRSRRPALRLGLSDPDSGT